MYTKGPWKVTDHNRNGDAYIGADGRPHFAIVEGSPFGFDETEANARLIATAPDLLEACKAMVTDFDLGESSIKTSLKLMETAIAKAEGE